MLGYIERMFSVLAESRHPSRQNPEYTVRYELRQKARGGDDTPYIAVFSTSQTGEVVSDLLLLYTTEATAREDWEKLIGPEAIKLEDLRFEKRIVDHHIGYGRDGSVVMY